MNIENVAKNITKVVNFSKENFLRCIEEVEGDYPKELIKKSDIFNYFYRYLKGDYEADSQKGFNTSIIVVEDNYISQAFLEDYVSRYARKFKPYSKFTRRLHFFQAKYNSAYFVENFVRGENKKIDWTKGYVGYIVIKPVSNSIFGATLLSTYIDKAKVKDKDEIRRYFPATLNQKSHLLGKEINVKSLGFQEQDRAVGACATNALWCAFHKTSELFGTTMPSPFQITNSASKDSEYYHDIIVDGEFGLSEYHITKTLKNIGLSWDKITRSKKYHVEHCTLKRYIYAYGKMGIPILIGFQRNIKDKNEEFHLVTVCGYRINKTSSVSYDESEIQLLSDYIDKLYAHDDLIGPFSKITFSEISKEEISNEEEKDNEEKVYQTIDTGYIQGSSKYPFCLPFTIIVPLYPTITIRYDAIHKSVVRFDDAFKDMELNSKFGFFNDVQWEIYLTSGIDYKEEILKNCKNKDIRLKVKNTSYPLYVWVGRLSRKKDGVPLIDIIYDSTDIGDGFCCYQINIMSKSIAEKMNVMVTIYKEFIKTMDADNNKSALTINHLKLLYLCTTNEEASMYGNIRHTPINELDNE